MKGREFDLDVGEGILIESEKGNIAIRVIEIDEQENQVFLEIDGDFDLKVELGEGTARELWGEPKCKGLPRIWLLFALVLGGKTKRDIFMPAFNEFVEDYVFAKNEYRGRWEKRWVGAAFSMRSVGMVAKCLRLQLWFWIALVTKLIWKKLFG